MMSALFRFDAELHEYFNLATGDVFPHITGLLEADGLIDDRWYNEESCERGTAVHDLTAEYDLGVVDVANCDSPYRGYVLAHIEAMRIIRPEFTHVEVPVVHPVYKFGGRPDRGGKLYKLRSVLEVKTGAADKAHQVQTALQAILMSAELNLPPEAIARFCIYLKPSGKARLVEHCRRADFDKARELIRKFC
jgi:hypothetical protein